MSILKLFLPTALLLTVNVANAVDATSQDLRYGIQASYGFGGDTFIKDGTTTLGTDTHTAGENSKYGLYVIKPELISALSGKLALNSISGSTDFTNASEDFSVISLDFLLVKDVLETVYIGAGLTYHLSPSYTYTDSANNISLDYDASLGFILEVTKVFRHGFELGLSYTGIEYSGIENDYNNYFSETVDASSFAFTVGYSF